MYILYKLPFSLIFGRINRSNKKNVLTPTVRRNNNLQYIMYLVTMLDELN